MEACLPTSQSVSMTNAASSVHQTELVLFMTLVQLILIILAARGMNMAARRLGQPGAVGEILAGLALGPSLLGHLLPGLSHTLFASTSSLPLTIISQIGLIFLMFQIGADFELGHLKVARNRRAVLMIGSGTILMPLGLGLAAGWLSAPFLAPGRDVFAYSLFVAVALAITAVPILGRIMREFDLTRTEIGVVTIAAAAANDVVGWLLLAVISAYVAAQFSPAGTALQMAGILGLLALAFLAGRPLVAWLLRRMPIEGGPGSETMSSSLMAIVLALIFTGALATYLLGIFAIFGGFLIGTLFFDHPAFVAAWRRQIGQFVLVFFLPVFFTFTGLRTSIGSLATPDQWLWLWLLLVAAIAGKMLPAFIGARACGFPRRDATIAGVLMNTRALMELIVLNVGYDLGIIPQNVFTMLVIVAVATTVMTAPLLRLCMARRGQRLMLRTEA
jgi:Kef-type K+ transport system membrane component KefB